MAAERANSSGKEQQPAASLFFRCVVCRRAGTLTQEVSWKKRAPWLVEEDIGKTKMVSFRRVTRIQGDPQSTLCNQGPWVLLRASPVVGRDPL